MNVVTDVIAWFADAANWRGPAGILSLLGEHLALTAASLGIACAVALPVALWLGHTGRGGVLAVQIGNIGRAVPTLALLSILLFVPPPFGRTTLSALVAFTLFAIPVLLTNTYVGMREVDPAAVDAAKGMGMSGFEVLRKVELPLATPALMNAVRQGAVQVVATVSIAAIFAFGGLGRIITRATGASGGFDVPQIIAGALVIAVVAIVVDLAFGALGRYADPVARARSRARRASASASASSEDTGREPVPA